MIADELLEHLSSRRGEPDAFVFTAADGGPMRHWNFYRRYYKR